MTPTLSEKLIRALCDDPTTSTAEAVGMLGVSADLLAVRKPSRDDNPPADAEQLEPDRDRCQAR